MDLMPRRPPECTWEGNKDLYGLGIRISLYIQYATALVCAFVPEKKRHRFKEANVIFGAAVFIEVFRLGVTKEALGPEIAIIFWLIAPSMGLYGLRPKRLFGLVTILTMCMTLAQTYYWTWLWFRGLDLMRRPECNHAIVWFFYAKVELYNWYRTFLKVMSTILAVSMSVNIIGYFIGACAFFLGGGRSADLETDDDDDEIKGQMSQACGTLFWGGVIAIPATELTLNWNHVSGVHSLSSASQLIPLLLSVGQLVYAMAEALKWFSRGYSSVPQRNDIELSTNRLVPRTAAPGRQPSTEYTPLPEIPKVTTAKSSSVSVNSAGTGHTGNPGLM